MYGDLLNTIGFVAETDPEIGEAMELELKRQRRNLELIASENIVSPAVLAAMGTVLTIKYAEGYPARRYYGGCQDVDGRAQVRVNARGVGEQPHAFAAERGEIVGGKHVDAGAHLGLKGCAHQGNGPYGEYAE